jgi:hypothetical protein
MTEPRCPTHGQMNFNIREGRWVCHGFDGEDCSYIVTAEQWYFMGEVLIDFYPPSVRWPNV